MNAPESRLHPEAPAAARRFGRFALVGLLGRSQRTMAWLVQDPAPRQELVLVMPRQQPGDSEALRQWIVTARRAARLDHPHLAPAIEVGDHGGWPYVAYDTRGATTLAARLQRQALAPREAASLVRQIGLALAYAHESGMVHADLQSHLVLLDDAGTARLIGLEVDQAAADRSGSMEHSQAAEAIAQSDRLRIQRLSAQRDVLALGLLLHLALTGRPPLDEADIGRVLVRLPPLGRDIVRLPWSTPRPVPDALRAIANRATDRQERQRYRSARTLVHALEGFLRTDAASGAGPLELLMDRLGSVGVLPASPGGAERAAQLALMERKRTDELAAVVLLDTALSFELIRLVNTAVVRGAQVAGVGPVLTVRRAVAMLGVDGVRRAALALRAWPGPLDDDAAGALRALMAQAQRAGRVAQALRQPQWDGEVVALVTLLQSLGPLVVQYHFPEDAAQVRRLMQPAPAAQPGAAEEPGMNAEAASYAVIGVDLDTVGVAVARHWGLGDGVVQMMRRMPLSAHVHLPQTDEEYLRALASCAHEAVEACLQPAEKLRTALNKVAQRYAHALHVTSPMLVDALKASLAPAPVAAAVAAGAEDAARTTATRDISQMPDDSASASPVGDEP